MARIPTDLNGAEVRKAFEKVGFAVTRQRGSHVVMHRQEPKGRLTVPDHNPVRVGTLRQLIADAGLSVEEFLKLL